MIPPLGPTSERFNAMAQTTDLYEDQASLDALIGVSPAPASVTGARPATAAARQRPPAARRACRRPGSRGAASPQGLGKGAVVRQGVDPFAPCASAPSARTPPARAAAGPRPRRSANVRVSPGRESVRLQFVRQHLTGSGADAEHERELGAVLARLEVHAAAGAAIAPGPARDRERAVLGVVKRTLDGDVAAREQRRPIAFV